MWETWSPVQHQPKHSLLGNQEHLGATHRASPFHSTHRLPESLQNRSPHRDLMCTQHQLFPVCIFFLATSYSLPSARHSSRPEPGRSWLVLTV